MVRQCLLTAQRVSALHCLTRGHLPSELQNHGLELKQPSVRKWAPNHVPKLMMGAHVEAMVTKASTCYPLKPRLGGWVGN